MSWNERKSQVRQSGEQKGGRVERRKKEEGDEKEIGCQWCLREIKKCDRESQISQEGNKNGGGWKQGRKTEKGGERKMDVKGSQK